MHLTSHARAFVPLVALACACAKAEPAAPMAPAPETAASAVRVPDPPPPRDAGTDTASAPTFDAGTRDAALAAAAPLDPRCAGAKIDLTAILLDGACVDGSRDDPAAPSLRVTVSAPPRLAPGAEGIVTVTYANTGATELDLHVALPTPTLALGGPGGGGFGFGGDKPSPPPPRAVPGRPSTKSADGKRSFDATWSVLTTMVFRYAHVRIAPGGAAELRVIVPARGFLPGKNYDSSGFDVDSPPDPLPPGRYKVTLRVPVATDGVASPIVDLEVHR